MSNSNKTSFNISINANQSTQVLSSASPSALASPFRIGGRGSKQLSKAVQQTRQQLDIEDCGVFCFASPTPCFAKVVSSDLHERGEGNGNTVLIQPMRESPHNSALYIPCDGHLLLSKVEFLHAVKVILLELFLSCIAAVHVHPITDPFFATVPFGAMLRPLTPALR